MVKKIFITVAVIWFALLVLMPKQELYYKLEQELVTKGIKINEQSIEEGWFSLKLHGLDVYAKGIKLAEIEEVNLFTVLVYTDVEIANLVLDESLKAMAPTKTEKANFTHAVWMPLEVDIKAQGSFGGLSGGVSLAEKTVRVDFNDSKAIENFQPKLKQDEKGWYYEASF